jgi:hypothetical protein
MLVSSLTVLPLYLNRHEYSEACEVVGYPHQSLTSSLVSLMETENTACVCA